MTASAPSKACARYGVTMDQAAEGLLKLQLTGKRLKVREARGIRVLDDSYNAAPDSVKSAIRTMEATPAERRVAILGAMNELGDDTPALHYEVGKYAAEHGISLVIGIEPKAAEIVRGAREAGCNALYFDEKEAREAWEDFLQAIALGVDVFRFPKRQEDRRDENHN